MTTNTLYVKSLPTPWLDLKKTDLTRAWRFLRTNKNSLLKRPPLLVVPWLKFVWYVHFAGQIQIYVSQEEVCKLWAALCPIFTDAYRKIRFPEEGKCASCFQPGKIRMHKHFLMSRLVDLRLHGTCLGCISQWNINVNKYRLRPTWTQHG